MEDGCGDGLLDLKDSRLATSLFHESASIYVSYLGSCVRHLRWLLAHLAGGSSPTSPVATTTRFSAPRSTPCSLVPLSRLRLLSWQFYGRISLLLSLHICLSDLFTDVLQIDLVSDLGSTRACGWLF